MRILFFKDKDIIFDTKNNNNMPKDCVFSKKTPVEDIIKAFETRDRVLILSNDTDAAFKKFTKAFKPLTAAGGVVLNAEGGLLMIKRDGVWDLPKGKLEKGEEIKACALREVEEETNVGSLVINGDEFVTQHFYMMKERWHLKTTYWYTMSTTHTAKLIPQTEEGITECAWLSSEQAAEAMGNTYSTIKYVLENFKHKH